MKKVPLWQRLAALAMVFLLGMLWFKLASERALHHYLAMQGSSETAAAAGEALATGIRQSTLKQYDKAIQSFTSAISANPVFADAYFERGNVYEIRNEFRRACIDYERAASLGHDAAAKKLNNLKSITHQCP